MKNLLIALFLFAATAQVANATQARLIALGLDELDNEGSYYIEDSRNIFLNASKVNDYSDMVIVEWGDDGRNNLGVNGVGTVYEDRNPKAQGGVLMSHGDFTYGAYFGNESNTSSFLRLASTSNAASINSNATPGLSSKVTATADNQLDLFFGHDLGNTSWGANFVYLNNEDDSFTQEDKAMALRLGAQGDSWDAHANISLQNEAKNTVSSNVGSNFGLGNASDSAITQEFDGSLGLHLGGSYEFDFGHIYGFAKKFEWDQKDSYDYDSGWNNDFSSGSTTVEEGKQGTNEGEFNTYSLGWGKVHDVNSNGKLFTNLQFKMVSIELNLAQKVEVNNTTLPLTFGYEHAATDWLTVRGSVTQNLYGEKDNKNFDYANVVVQNLVSSVYGGEGKGSIANSTRVHAGATLTFGNLQVDGVIGTENAAGGGFDASSETQNGILSLDNAMATVAATYKF